MIQAPAMSRIYPVTLPKWGLEMSEGAIAAWRLEEGAPGAKGVELVDIETEKIVNTLELEHDGVLRRRLAPVGATLPVGALIAVVADANVSESEIDAFVASYRPVNASFEPGAETAAPQPAAQQTNGASAPTTGVASALAEAASSDEIKRRNAAAHASPIARRLADQLGLDLSKVTGTGKEGRISQADVEAAAATLEAASSPKLPDPSPAPETAPAAISEPLAGPAARRLAREENVDLREVAPTGEKGRIQKEDVRRAADARRVGPAEQRSELTPWTPMRRTIAEALLRAKQTAPHFYASMDIALDDALPLLERLNRSGGARVSLNDFFVKATGRALTETPDVNIHVEADGVRRFSRADIAIAVAIDGGLVTPVLRDVDGMDIRALATDSAALIKRARERTLTADDLKAATFTISNLGMHGVRAFDAIINPPQGAILAIGAARREARETPAGVAFGSVATVTLSCDHRAIDGAMAARFLSALKRIVEDPLSLVL